MAEYTLMSFNLEHMRDLFSGSGVRPEQAERARRAAERIAAAKPHVLGLVEASDKPAHHEAFLALPPLAGLGYRVVRGAQSRGRQDLVFYCRAPFEPVAVDDAFGFYEDWTEDIDQDGILEVCTFERRPLEVVFEVQGTGARVRLVLVATKSKGVFGVQDFFGHQHRALANRKRLLAQCSKLRTRADRLLAEDPGSAFVLLGDFNDDPGYDNYERMLGASGIERVMGSVYEPERILHNALWHHVRAGKEVWTTTYPDLIVENRAPHRAWLDHILVSPAMLRGDCPVRYVRDSGEVGEEEPVGVAASDHRPVLCRIEA